MRGVIVADAELMDRIGNLTEAEVDQISAACITLNRVIGWSPNMSFVPLDVVDVLGIRYWWDNCE